MPRFLAVHFNPPDDAEHTACGRKLAKVKWDTSKERVTCKACKRVMK